MNKRIVICGSMSLHQAMKHHQNKFEKKGLCVYIPSKDEVNFLELTNEEQNRKKAIASKVHFAAIIDKSTAAILVLNEPKKGILNYIGPNAFAEIAFAFFFGKQIYLLNDIYEFYREELLAWGAVSLKGDVSSLVKFMNDIHDD